MIIPYNLGGFAQIASRNRPNRSTIGDIANYLICLHFYVPLLVLFKTVLANATMLLKSAALAGIISVLLALAK